MHTINTDQLHAYLDETYNRVELITEFYDQLRKVLIQHFQAYISEVSKQPITLTVFFTSSEDYTIIPSFRWLTFGTHVTGAYLRLMPE